MIVAWMLYAVAITTLAFVGGVAADRMIAAWNGARRGVWLVALVVAAFVPVVLATRRPPFRPSPALTVSVPDDFPRAPASVDALAREAWTATSGLALLLYVVAIVRLRLRERRWHPAELDGEPVLVAPDLGPALLGVAEPRIVVPAWAFDLDVRSRRLMLRHEDEHIRGGDPALLRLAALTLVLFPWNPALWLIVARLRLAVEIDCDARVLLDGDEGAEYGMLLLAVSARRRTSFPIAASLAEHTPDIERRIIAMSEAPPRWALLSSLALAMVVATTVALGVTAPRPISLRQAKADGLARLPAVKVRGHLPRAQAHVVTLDSSGATSRHAPPKRPR